MYHSFGFDKEVDHVRILQSCNGLLLCTGSEWLCFYYVYNPSTNLFKRLPQANYYLRDDLGFFRCGVFRLAFDLRKSIHYKVVLAEHPSGDTWIHIYSSETGNWSFCIDRLNIEDNDHPIMTTLDIPHGLHRGRNFLESFGGHSNDQMLLLMEIPHMLHLEGKFFESCGCLLLVCKDDIGLEDAFVVIIISKKVIKYNLILKNTTKIFDIGSNQMDDDDVDDAVEFIPPFEVDPNIYEFIPSLASV
ncbi:hypothetical protein Tco_1572504 [Tanacetum coccineum]